MQENNVAVKLTLLTLSHFCNAIHTTPTNVDSKLGLLTRNISLWAALRQTECRADQ
jgi:hypothetical protein